MMIHFSHGIFSSYLQAELLLALSLCYFLKILICFLFKLAAYVCLSASSEWGCYRSSPNTQQESELLQWLPGSAGQSTVMGWRGEQEASCYFFLTHPPYQTAYFLPLMVSA